MPSRSSPRKLPDPYPRQDQFMVIEMASAFLLVENVIDHFTTPPDDLEQQIVIMGGWLLDAAKGKSTGEPPAGLRARPHAADRRAAAARAGREGDHSPTCSTSSRCSTPSRATPSKRDTLPALPPYLRQIHGALVVLRLRARRRGARRSARR